MENTYKIAIGPALPGKLPPGDPRWHSFNAGFVNQDVDQLTLAANIYDGHAFTTWHRNNWRASENFLLGQHLALDFDTEDARSTLPALQREPFIAKHAALVYTTPSHTPDKPRARVVFLLDTPIYQAKNYTAAMAALLWLYGTADRQCKDAVRFFYGGKPGACEMEWLNNELPLALVKDLIARYQATGAQTKHHTTRIYTPNNASEEEVMAALRCIPAWGITYDEWIRVLMALHSAFPDSGLSMAEAWAEGKPGEVERKWKSFKTDGNTAGRVGLGTLFSLAKRYGHQPQGGNNGVGQT